MTPYRHKARVSLGIAATVLFAASATARPVPHPPHLAHPTAMSVHAPPAPHGGGGHPPGPGPGPGPHPGPGPSPHPAPGPPPPGPGPGPHPPGPGPHPPGPPPPPPPPHWGWDNDYYWNHPLATAAAVGVVAGTAAAVTEAALGTTVYTLPTECMTVFSGNLTYFHCGSAWYQPRYAGTGVTYIVVDPPG